LDGSPVVVPQDLLPPHPKEMDLQKTSPKLCENLPAFYAGPLKYKKSLIKLIKKAAEFQNTYQAQ
jgi:hypothetical protein